MGKMKRQWVQLLGLIYMFTKVVTGAAVQDCHPVDQCTCKLDDGRHISLWEVDKKGGYKADDTLSRGFTYQYSPCSALKITGTECNKALVCQKSGTDNFAIAYKPKAVSTGYDTYAEQYTFSYTGSSTKTTSNRITTVNLVCDKNNKQPLISTVTEQPSGTYGFTFTTRCACPGECKWKASYSYKSSGLSTGSILCIVLLVLVIVYVIGGILVNKYVRHQEKSDLIPHKTFWKDLPFLVKDGCVFTAGKISGKKGEYSVIS